jgi:hypothetical protein
MSSEEIYISFQSCKALFKAPCIMTYNAEKLQNTTSKKLFQVGSSTWKSFLEVVFCNFSPLYVIIQGASKRASKRH